MNRIVDKVCNEYTLLVIGDLNGWAGDKVRVGITGTFEFL